MSQITKQAGFKGHTRTIRKEIPHSLPRRRCRADEHREPSSLQCKRLGGRYSALHGLSQVAGLSVLAPPLPRFLRIPVSQPQRWLFFLQSCFFFVYLYSRCLVLIVTVLMQNHGIAVSMHNIGVCALLSQFDCVVGRKLDCRGVRSSCDYFGTTHLSKTCYYDFF